MEPPNDITLPRAGSTTTRRWLGAYLKQMLSDLLQLPMGRFDARVFDTFVDIRAHLQRLVRNGDAGLVFSILRRPTHSTLVRCLHAELWGKGDVDKLDAWLAELTALVATDLAAAMRLPSGGVRLAVRPERLLSIGEQVELRPAPSWSMGFVDGAVILERDGERVEVALGGAVEAPGQDDVEVAHPYRPIDEGLLLATADNNPLSEFEAHPDKSGNAIDLGGKPVSEWTGSLAAALALVDEHVPELGSEIRLVMQTIVPVGYDDHRHLSASYAEAIGTAYLSLHPDPMTMAEALIHEFSHNKINVLWSLDDVVENAYEPTFASPVRPDPRPLHGILLAVHAFVPVARLYEKMLEAEHPLAKKPSFVDRYRQIVGGNHDGTETLLENAKPTPIGRAVLDELARWDEHFQRVAPSGFSQRPSEPSPR